MTIIKDSDRPRGPSMGVLRKKMVIGEDLGPYLRKWIPISILVGTVAGFGAVIFQYALEGIWHISYESFAIPWYLILFIPALGGLLAGVIINQWAPETAGSGTDHVINSVHHRGGRIRGRVVPVKLAASALTIGSGGSSGNEGPISQISGGIASFIGTRLRLSRSEMRILVISGMAAGWSAVFRAPLGSAIFAIEVPYKNDMESSAVVPSIVSSITSYLVFIPFGGTGPLFSSDVPEVSIDAGLLAVVLLLGLMIGLVGIAFVLIMKNMQQVFRRSMLPLPAATFIGGLGVGVIGLAYPQVLGLGEGTINILLEGTMLTLGFVAVLILVKIVATSLTVGSGGSGGIFFPSLIVGGCVGSALALGLGLQPYALFVLVGMGAMMAGVSKTPIAASVLMTEMVGGFAILIPLMIASTVSYLVTGKYSLFDAQLTSGKMGVDYSTLGDVKVKDIMSPSPVAIDVNSSTDMIVHTVHGSPHKIYPVTENGKVVGIISRRMIEEGNMKDDLFPSILQKEFQRIAQDSSAADAFELMVSRKVSVIIVVDSLEENNLTGVLTRIDVLQKVEHLDEGHLEY